MEVRAPIEGEMKKAAQYLLEKEKQAKNQKP
jgi:hypothetical protein